MTDDRDLAVISRALRGAAEQLRPTGRDGAWFLAAVLRALNNGSALVDELGIPRVPGRRKPGTVARLARRDALVRDLARCFAMSAREIAEALERYSAAGWLRDRDHDDCPQRHRGTAMALLWHVLKINGSAPSTRSVQSILARSERGLFVAPNQSEHAGRSEAS